MGKMQPMEKELRRRFIRSYCRLVADVVTLGNHAFDNKAIFDFIEDATKNGTTAQLSSRGSRKGIVYVKCNDKEVAVINLQGRVFMNTLDDPLQNYMRRLRKLEREHRLSLSTFMPK